VPHLFATKPLKNLIEEASFGEHRLRRTLGPLNLMALGIGAIIGIGIFVLTGIAAARFAGPAVILSFVLAAVCCLFSGLCYAELASTIPLAGSAYTYTYATLGEIVAWIIGWDLVLEYSFGAAVVASGWSGYLTSFLANFGLRLPPYLRGTFWDDFLYYKDHWEQASRVLPELRALGINPATLPHAHGVCNLAALIIVAAVSLILIVGIRESARFNATIVFVKISVLLFFIGVGSHYLVHHPTLSAVNWHPFIPPNAGSFGNFGWSGIARAAAFLLFAFIGIDAISAAAEESSNPQRDVPIGVLGALGVCTVLYLLIASVLVGLVNYKNLDVADPLAVGVDATGLHWGTFLVTLGALGSLTSTLVVVLLGQSRVLYLMSQDGLLPSFFSRIHPRFQTPHVSSIIAGIFVALLTAMLPIHLLTEMVSIGALLAFGTVCAGVWVLRRRRPDVQRAFKTPWMPFVPIVGILISLGMMLSLSSVTWFRLGVWFAIGLSIYLFYGQNHSRVQQTEDASLSGFHADLASGQAGHTAPEREFLSRMLQALLLVFVIVIGLAVLLGGLSVFFPTLDQHFPIIAPALSLLAIFAGLTISIFPELKSLWSLRETDVAIDEEREKKVRELIDSLHEGSDGSATKT
jgi:basic amino acid/polyamine antiporter, APA family